MTHPEHHETHLRADLGDLIQLVPSIGPEWAERALPDPHDLASACLRAPAPEGDLGLLDALGSPAIDVCITPLSARAALIALAHGAATFHHERRVRLPMPPDLAPPTPVWTDGDRATVPRWEAGVLAEPKYFSFFQDAPLPAYHPNHRRKWRAHELLHTAVGFLWHPQITPFEAYLGARLGELLPVVHWYGWDEIARPRCIVHKGQILYGEYCADCEAIAKPYWSLPADRREGRRAESERASREARAHFIEEWRACWQEITSGHPHATPRPNLDASSDAIGYLRSHWPRQTAWSFGAWVERFLIEGTDYVASADGYARRIAAITQRLVDGSVAASSRRAALMRARRAHQDLAYRALLLIEWGDHWNLDIEAEITPALDALAHRATAMLDEQALVGAQDAELAGDLIARVSSIVGIPEGMADAFGAVGHDITGARSPMAQRAQLWQGIESGAPHTAHALHERLDDQGLHDLLDTFVADPIFWALGPLNSRLARWLRAHEAPEAGLTELEAWMVAPPHRDAEAEDFGVLIEPDSEWASGGGELRLSRTYRRCHAEPQAIEAIGVDAGGQAHECIGAIVRGESVIAFLEGARLRSLIEALERGPITDPDAQDLDGRIVLELLELGVAVWLPRPRLVSGH